MKATTEYAQNKLGNRFISAEMITNTFGIKYPPEAKKVMEETFPDEDFIGYLAGNRDMLIAGPWCPINCYEIAGLNPFYIQLDIGGLCNADIISNEKIGPMWLAFSRFSSAADYHYGTLEKQENYFLKNNATDGHRKEGFLSVAEMLWAIGAVSSVNKSVRVYSFFNQALKVRTGTNSGFDGRKIAVCADREGKMSTSKGFPNDRDMMLVLKFIS